ncbi:MAG: polysaccharide biosynthesis C-terminal domain-containing protein [Sphingobacteriales bacterium]|nr:MAG: polysaccharide biosynthesis C-terminal domain-containing protein [Sphingobacteriales bacterium]
MGLAKKLASETAAYSVSSILARFINYLFGLFIIRYISAEEYGVYSKLYAYAGFLLVFLTHGMETTFFRFLHKEDSKNNAFFTAFSSVIGCTLLFVLFVFLGISPIQNFVEESAQLIKIFAFIMVFDVFCALPYASLRAQNRPLKFAFFKILNILLFIFSNIIFFIVLPYLNIKLNIPKVEYIFISNLIASVLTFIILLFQIPKLSISFDTQLYKKMLIYGLPVMLVGLAGMTNEMLDRAMMTKLLPYDTITNKIHLGIYSFNYKFAMPITMFLQAYRFAAEPIFFKEASSENNRDMYAQMMKFYIICACFIFLAIITLMPLFKAFFIWYTPTAQVLFQGLFIVPILLLANMCLGVYFNLSTWYKVTDRTYFGAIISVIGASVTVVLNIILVPKIGYVGSAWSTLACYVVMLLVGYVLERKYFPIPYAYKRIGLYLSITMLIFVIYKMVIEQHIPNLFFQVLLSVFILGTYSGIVYKVEKNKTITNITN